MQSILESKKDKLQVKDPIKWVSFLVLPSTTGKDTQS
jgi:hypothetical protein